MPIWKYSILRSGLQTRGRQGQLTGGTIAPGSSPGHLTLNGSVSINSGTLSFELGGTTGGVNYDALDISGSLTLNALSNLSLAFFGGFETSILDTDTFTLAVANGGINGQFANLVSGSRLATTDGLGSFLVHYGPGSAFGENNIVLSGFEAVPEPSSTMLLLVGVVSLALQRKRLASGMR